MKKLVISIIPFMLFSAYLFAQENSTLTRTLKGSFWIADPVNNTSSSSPTSTFFGKIISFSENGDIRVIEFQFDTLINVAIKFKETVQQYSLVEENERTATYKEKVSGIEAGQVHWLNDIEVSLSGKLAQPIGHFTRLGTGKRHYIDWLLFDEVYGLREGNKEVPKYLTECLDYIIDINKDNPIVTYRKFNLKNGDSLLAPYLYIYFGRPNVCDIKTKADPKKRMRGYKIENSYLITTKILSSKPDKKHGFKWNNPREFELTSEDAKQYTYVLSY